MANLKLLSALLIVLFAVATATTYTTTITTVTTTDDEGSSSEQASRQQCKEEIQSQELNMCESFLSQEQQSSRLRMVVKREGKRQEQEQEAQQQQQCCQQLKEVKSKCRCAAIEDVVKRQMQGGQSMHSQQMKQILEKAQNLPRVCDWQEPQKCSIQPSWFA